MANSLGRLVVMLGLDAAEYTKGLTKSEYQAQQWARNVEKGVELARASLVGLGAAAVGAVAIVNAQADKIAAFQDLADQVGDSAEAVASLTAASQLSGTSLDTVAAASVKLTSALAKTDDEAKGVGHALGAIGIELEAFRRLSPVEQLDAVAQALAGFEDGAGKTAVAVELFGRSGAQLIPMFNDLADGAERQIFLTQEQIEAADAYSKQVARLTSELQNMATVAAADAVPQLSAMAAILQDLVTYSRDTSDGFGILEGVLSGARVVLETIVVLGSDVAFVFKGIGREIGGMAAQLAALATLDLNGFNAISEAMRQDAERARRELDAFQRNVLNPIRFNADDQSAAEARRLGLAGPTKSLNYVAPPSGPKKKKDGGASPLTYDEQITQRVGALLEGSAVTQAKVYADQLAKLDELFFSGALSAELYESAVEKLAGTTDAASRQASKFVEEQKRLADLLGATESAGIEKQRQDMELLTRALQEGLITEQQYTEAATARLGLVAEKTKEAKTFAEEFGLAFSSAFEDAIVAGGDLSDVLKGLEQDILRIIIRKSVTEPLGNFISSGVGSFFKGLFSFDGGGYTGAGARSGGMDGKGGFLAMMHPNETVIDHTRRNMAAGGGGANVTVNVINQSGTPVNASTQQRGTAPDGSQLVEIVLTAVGEALANRSGPAARGLEAGYGLRAAPV